MKFWKFLKVVKTVVKENLPQFCRTFWRNKQGVFQRNREACNISERRTVLVFQLPNQARYQTSLSPEKGITVPPDSRAQQAQKALYTITPKKANKFFRIRAGYARWAICSEAAVPPRNRKILTKSPPGPIDAPLLHPSRTSPAYARCQR